MPNIVSAKEEQAIRASFDAMIRAFQSGATSVIIDPETLAVSPQKEKDIAPKRKRKMPRAIMDDEAEEKVNSGKEFGQETEK